jgi:hypothetical protein
MAARGSGDMMQKASEPITAWAGFKPGAYTLDTMKAIALPLQRVVTDGTGGLRKEATTVGAVCDLLFPQTLATAESRPLNQTAITTNAGVTVLEGDPFARDLVIALLELRKEGADGLQAWWFWYDKDYVTDDPDHESYSFFVVYDGRIVDDARSFRKHAGSGFVPNVFELHVPHNNMWRNASVGFSAFVRYWYRRFYKETTAGQLMTLREDAPPLFYYPEGRFDQPALLEAMAVNVTRLRGLMRWMILLLLLIALALWVKA